MSLPEALKAARASQRASEAACEALRGQNRPVSLPVRLAEARFGLSGEQKTYETIWPVYASDWLGARKARLTLHFYQSYLALRSESVYFSARYKPAFYDRKQRDVFTCVR